MDDFIGQKFGKENQFEVLTCTHETIPSGWNKFYLCMCLKCALDPELHGQALYKCLKGNLRLGQLPCGCSKRPAWTQQQQILRVSRKCEERNLSFIDFVEYIGTSTKLILKCNRCENIWKNCTINNFLNHSHGNGCPVCATSGFKRNLPATFYVLKIVGKFEFTGFGITNNWNQRLQHHRKSLRDNNCEIEEMQLFHMSGEKAILTEQNVLLKFKNAPQIITGFKREALCAYAYDELIQFIGGI